MKEGGKREKKITGKIGENTTGERKPQEGRRRKSSRAQIEKKVKCP